jgi:hypothetical protein
MTKDEALKQALEALELHGNQYPHMVKGYCLDAITAIKQALAATTVQELVTDEAVEAYCKAWGESFSRENKFDVLEPLSDDLKKHIRAGLKSAFTATGRQSLQDATPPAQPAVPLTDEQIDAVRFSIPTKAVTQRDFELARAIEAAHGITKGQP